MESSPQVNLYIETTVHGPRQQGGRWMYLLEFVTRRGDPVTPMEGWGLGGGEGKRAYYAGVVCSVGPTAAALCD